MRGVGQQEAFGCVFIQHAAELVQQLPVGGEGEGGMKGGCVGAAARNGGGEEQGRREWEGKLVQQLAVGEGGREGGMVKASRCSSSTSSSSE